VHRFGAPAAATAPAGLNWGKPHGKWGTIPARQWPEDQMNGAWGAAGGCRWAGVVQALRPGPGPEARRRAWRRGSKTSRPAGRARKA